MGRRRPPAPRWVAPMGFPAVGNKAAASVCVEFPRELGLPVPAGDLWSWGFVGR